MFNFLYQVEHMLNDRLLQFVSVDLQDVKVLFIIPSDLLFA